ncbi:hypothetical protein V5O48_005985 [Marasmius crinis-equi]|uniref:DUF7726 domain-containing protein n=1 Tax=Marasmius crinis-equi TaxID=585013 RepID=A0ABR3FLL7_9AGAR
MPKRKSNALSDDEIEFVDDDSKAASTSGSKKTRVADASTSNTKEKDTPRSWRDIVLDEPKTGPVPIFDDPGEVRRKIRLLLKTPGFKAEIGNINSNSYNRFMSMKGRCDGASNGTYYAAYAYFEKVRIFEGKKKTAKRLANEREWGIRGRF